MLTSNDAKLKIRRLGGGAVSYYDATKIQRPFIASFKPKQNSERIHKRIATQLNENEVWIWKKFVLFYFDTRILQKVYRRTQICEINGTAYNLETEGGRKICEKGDIW